ncbi:hypothetical protein, partial, partial [Parasitella parasitica]
MKTIHKNESIITAQEPEIQRQQVENTTNNSNVDIDDDMSVEDVSQDVSDPESDCDVDYLPLFENNGNNEEESEIDDREDDDDEIEELEIRDAMDIIMANHYHLFQSNDNHWDRSVTKGFPFENPQTLVMMCLFNGYAN